MNSVMSDRALFFGGFVIITVNVKLANPISFFTTVDIWRQHLSIRHSVQYKTVDQ